jgi:hypothetical protein
VAAGWLGAKHLAWVLAVLRAGGGTKWSRVEWLMMAATWGQEVRPAALVVLSVLCAHISQC